MSSRFRQVFSNQHVILPVIHVESDKQAIRNALIAKNGGCDGVFLINHQINHDELMIAHAAVKSAAPDLWVGINSLGREPATLFADRSLDGIWADNAGIEEDEDNQPYADRVRRCRDEHGWKGLYFGGVAFKYQRRVTALGEAARIATDYMDVVTTSGPGTGSAAAVSKIQAMKEAIPAFPLAIASGITPENVSEYLPHADCFLVATGISRSFTEFDPRRVEALVRNTRSAASAWRHR